MLIKCRCFERSFNPVCRLYGESIYQKTKKELYRDFIVLENLKQRKTYQIRVVAVDGMYVTPSIEEEVNTYMASNVSAFFSFQDFFFLENFFFGYFFEKIYCFIESSSSSC